MSPAVRTKSPSQNPKAGSSKAVSRSWFQKIYYLIFIRVRAKRIVKSYREAEAIDGGRKKGKTFDEFLREF